jgi:hypothetical protein
MPCCMLCYRQQMTADKWNWMNNASLLFNEIVHTYHGNCNVETVRCSMTLN